MSEERITYHVDAPHRMTDDEVRAISDKFRTLLTQPTEVSGSPAADEERKHENLVRLRYENLLGDLEVRTAFMAGYKARQRSAVNRTRAEEAFERYCRDRAKLYHEAYKLLEKSR